MFNHIFDSVFSQNHTNINPGMLVISIGISLILGVLLAATYKHKTLYTKEFVTTVTLLPTLIAIIIFLVNGNLGTSVAVAGTFSLIRFRSAAGGAKEILTIFIATAIGIATGMGLLILATVFTLILCSFLILFENSEFVRASQTHRQVIAVVPDDFDYEYVFEGAFTNICKQIELTSLKTLNKKNSLELTYFIELRPDISDKQFINQLSSYKDNIEITISRAASKKKIL